jgi:hypothetical protein
MVRRAGFGSQKANFVVTRNSRQGKPAGEERKGGYTRVFWPKSAQVIEKTKDELMLIGKSAKEECGND